MPLYEYICQACRKRYTVLIGMTAQADTNICPHCGNDQAIKRMTRFARGKSDGELIDALSDPDMMGDLDDPKTMRRWAKEVSSTVGEDLGDDFDEYIDAAEGGE